ncbi:TIR domain-containing protein [Sphaerotilus sp.]|uniref:TIR domain-containing protein n=1 Tax=Sphaerotilus sp. TaxID=2093942 RepID=UPI002ACE7C84|nr:TIR domain-containing protein [Sphaerotilus sp.]MDZ7856962.1 TIR domain-containing protein [Sphaerotilus sp.]
MEKCQTCFKIAEDTYVAPALLPLEDAVAGQIASLWQGAEAKAEVKLNYAFLHEGVLRALLCGIGSQAGVQAVYWRYGVCFYDQKAAGVVRIHSELPDPSGQGGGWISVETTGANAAALARSLVASIERINIGAKPEVVWRDEAPAGREVEPAEPFAALQPGPQPLALSEPRPVYVSYAWGGESERLVDALEGRLADRGYVLRRDKRELRPGHWISEFEREIARADRVIVVLSSKYLKSIYCMQELVHLHAQVLGDRARFHGKVIAIPLDEVNITDPCDRLDCTLYWQGEHERLEVQLAKVKMAQVGDQTRLRLWAMDDIQKKADTILGWIADVLMPRGAASLDAAIERLQS